MRYHSAVHAGPGTLLLELSHVGSPGAKLSQGCTESGFTQLSAFCLPVCHGDRGVPLWENPRVPSQHLPSAHQPRCGDQLGWGHGGRQALCTAFYFS